MTLIQTKLLSRKIDSVFIFYIPHISTLSLPVVLLISVIDFPLCLSLSDGISLVSLELRKGSVVGGPASVN